MHKCSETTCELKINDKQYGIVCPISGKNFETVFMNHKIEEGNESHSGRESGSESEAESAAGEERSESDGSETETEERSDESEVETETDIKMKKKVIRPLDIKDIVTKVLLTSDDCVLSAYTSEIVRLIKEFQNLNLHDCNYNIEVHTIGILKMLEDGLSAGSVEFLKPNSYLRQTIRPANSFKEKNLSRSSSTIGSRLWKNAFLTRVSHSESNFHMDIPDGYKPTIILKSHREIMDTFQSSNRIRNLFMVEL